MAAMANLVELSDVIEGDIPDILAEAVFNHWTVSFTQLSNLGNRAYYRC